MKTIDQIIILPLKKLEIYNIIDSQNFFINDPFLKNNISKTNKK